LPKYQKGWNASGNVLQASPENSNASSILRAVSPSTSRTEAVTASRVNSKSLEMLSSKRRHYAWERLNNNLRRNFSSTGRTSAARLEAESVRVQEILSDTHILRRHYRAALLRNINPEKHVAYKLKLDRYAKMQSVYTKKVQVLLKDAEAAAARVRASN